MRSKQLSLFPNDTRVKTKIKPVNIASVPLRSPFRYPGGKTWFVPTFRKWLSSLSEKPELLIEPFVGGGIVSLTALFENLVSRVVIVELDEDIAAVWQTIVDGDTEWLSDRILSFNLTVDSVKAELQTEPRSIREQAFQTILKNRTFHGGILAKGSGLIKNGENGKGISSRWYPKTLAKRLRNISFVSERIDFRQEDGLVTMKEYSVEKNAVFFIDPPYTVSGKRAGRRLYKYSELNHELLFDLCDDIKGDYIITYDNNSEVRNFARQHSMDMRLVPMKTTHHVSKYELVIGKDMTWMDADPLVCEPDESYK